MVHSCAALNCNKRHGSKDKDGRDVTFHRFPLSNSALNQKWIAAVRRENFHPTTNLRLCSIHFEEGCYLSNYVNRRQLRDDAVPTIFDFADHENKVSRERSPLKSGNDIAGYKDNESVIEMSHPSTTSEHDYSMSSSLMLKRKYETKTEEKGDKIAKYKGYIKTQHSWKSKQEDLLAKQHTLDNLRRELCRLCGQKGSELVPIFEPTSGMSKDMPISSKIDMYLPIKVKLEDSLPFCICSNCLLVLNQWHELYTTCVAADSVFAKTFGKESHVNVNKPRASEVKRNAETQTEGRLLGASKDKIPADAGLSLDSLTDEMKGNDICAHCGESKTSLLEEDKLFKEECVKIVRTYRNISQKCRFCFELFKDSADRKNHMAMCHQLSTICELCGHEVPHRKDLKRHKYDRHKASPQTYPCDKCHKIFKSSSVLRLHHKTVHGAEDGSEKYCCELCGGLFSREIYYRNHKRKHEMGKVKTVFQIESFRQEVNSEGSENGVIYVCPVCQEKFDDAKSLAVHLTEKKELKCALCPKVANSEKNLFLHVCGQWTCRYCLKSFDKRVKWLVHVRMHTGEKPLKCRKCDKTFRSWQSRRFHEANHEPSFQCTYCGKSFKNKYVFQDHVSCHEGKEFSCQICEKTFSGRKSLGRHVRNHHKDF